jgi:hypothetical protein
MLSSVQAADKAKSDDGSQIIVELGDAMTLGEFTYEDTTIDISEEIFNPRGGIEFRFGGTPFSIGGEYAQSENTFDGEYEESDGTMDVERTEYVAFLRLGHKNGTNLRLGYRSFEYDFSDAIIHQDNGETDIDGEASGDLTTGYDAELTLAIGSDVQFALAVGGTYFTDAKYEWSYTAIGGPNPGFHAGSAKLDAYSARIRPELSFAAGENLRIFVNAMVSASTWQIDEDDDEATPDYPGVDVYSAIGAGIRYTFGL